MSRTGEPGHVRKQVFSKPDLIREFAPKFDQQVQERVDPQTCLDLHSVYGFGCGDSHNAATASRLAFHKWAKIRMDALPALEFARYTAPFMDSSRPKQSMAIGVSISGEVARTVEAIYLAKEAGAVTVGVTCNPGSTLAKTADVAIDITTPWMDIPRIRTYTASQIAMYQMALRLAEVRKAISGKEGQTIRDWFLRAADIGEATHAANSVLIRELAHELRNAPAFFFLGGGPNLGSAMFSAAKILECEGGIAQPQDLEEWVHLQRFQKRTELPTFLIAPYGLSYKRAVEQARVIKRVQAKLIAVVENDEKEISSIADHVIRIQGHLPEEMTPLVFSDPLEIFASDLAEENKEPYFRDFSGPWTSTDADDPIWFNEKLTSRSQLDLDA
jgi:glucosamine--fructose-6-phosphate aminotransferase (isomerizing)